MKKIYLVPWIEVEFGWGSRPEGYKVFLEEKTCIACTKEDSISGQGAGGYFGPVRPLRYYEAPLSDLPEELQLSLQESKNDFVWPDNSWKPSMKSNPKYID